MNRMSHLCNIKSSLPRSVPCDLTPPSTVPGDAPHLILWYKNIFGTPIYRSQEKHEAAGGNKNNPRAAWT